MPKKATAEDIINESRKFRTMYGNPSRGIPKEQDFDWYVLGRIDQVYEKQDENFKLILSKMDEVYKEVRESISKKVNKGTFWKVNSFLMVIISILIASVIMN